MNVLADKCVDEILYGVNPLTVVDIKKAFGILPDKDNTPTVALTRADFNSLPKKLQDMANTGYVSGVPVIMLDY